MIALGRRNWTFAGSDAGGERAAAIYTLTQTARLNGLDPERYPTDVLTKIGALSPFGDITPWDRLRRWHPIRRIDDLLPWSGSAPA